MSRTYYMHTLNGEPAYFDGDQVVFATFYGKAAPLARSLNQIRAEQRKSGEWREMQGFKDHDRYGHLRVRLPGDQL